MEKYRIVHQKSKTAHLIKTREPDLKEFLHTEEWIRKNVPIMRSYELYFSDTKYISKDFAYFLERNKILIECWVKVEPLTEVQKQCIKRLDEISVSPVLTVDKVHYICLNKTSIHGDLQNNQPKKTTQKIL